MTVDEAIEKLVEMSSKGHGKKKLGLFDHEWGQFMTITDFVTNRDVDRDEDSEIIVEAQASWKEED